MSRRLPMTRTRSTGVGLCLACALLLGWACDGPTDDDVPLDDDAGDDDAGDDDAGDDDAGDDDSGEPCEPTIEWGFGGNFQVGEVVGNWSLSGYVDGDQDGVVEQTKVAFDLEDIHCAGYQSVALVAGDST
jgi:hypothetical protein